MDLEVDHYAVLGLPSGEVGAKLTEKDISKAYRVKALELHPDKRRNDPNAHDNFQALKSSYEILKDEKARKLFDDLLRVKRDQQRRHSERDSRKRKMVSDLEERERSSFAPDSSSRERAEEERIAQKLKEEIARIRAMMTNSSSKASPFAPAAPKKTEVDGSGGTGVDKGKILKVSWDRIGRDYSSERLREVFSEFGEVEDVITKSTKNKKKGAALVVMASPEAASAATRRVCGDISNPLLVLPLQPVSTTTPFAVPSFRRSPESEKLDHLPGIGYQAFENNVLKKLREAAEKQKK